MDEPMSLEVAALVASLHLSDLAALDRSAKGKGRLGEQSDEQHAFELYARGLEELQQLENDRRFALSLEAAGHADARALDALQAEEDEARRDRDIAIAVSRGRTMQQARAASVASRGSSNAASATVSRATSATRIDADASPTAPVASSSRSTVVCVVCTDRVSSSQAVVALCPSRHAYCRNCILDLFNSPDESLFPPRCEGVPIPLDLVRSHMTPPQIQAFERKALEFRTANRLYCATASCSAFLGAATGHKSAVRCEACKSSTCAACKAPWHGIFGACGAAPDDEVADVLERELHYKRCPGCRRMVELSLGCFHMTCLCRTEFCYLCAAPWKTCGCPQWDENRLLRAAEDRVRIEDEERPRQRHPLAAPAIPQAARVAEMVERLRVDHECRHASWRFRGGGGQCEHCYFRLPSYLFRCNGCGVLACNRCRRNRL